MPFEMLDVLDTAANDGMLMDDAKVGDRICYVVEYRDSLLFYRWFIDKGDMFIRRAEIAKRKLGSMNAMVLEITNLRRDIASADFTLAAPPGFAEREYTGKRPKVGEPAPEWNLTTLDGEPISLRGLRGKVVVLDFWATWCAPCLRAMPHIQELHQRYQDAPVEIIGLTFKETKDAKAYCDSEGFSYPVAVGDEVAELYGVKGLPFVFVIAPDGTLVDYFDVLNPQNRQILERTIRRSLPST